MEYILEFAHEFWNAHGERILNSLTKAFADKIAARVIDLGIESTKLLVKAAKSVAPDVKDWLVDQGAKIIDIQEPTEGIPFFIQSVALGAAAGAYAGSVLPGIGTIAGITIGSIISGVISLAGPNNGSRADSFDFYR